jgi:hypothetical protein
MDPGRTKPALAQRIEQTPIVYRPHPRLQSPIYEYIKLTLVSSHANENPVIVPPPAAA